MDLNTSLVSQAYAKARTAAAPQPQAGAADAGWQDLCSTALPAGFAVHSDPDALFYTATGGTTGMPKAVMWPHGAAWQAFGVATWMRGPGEPPSAHALRRIVLPRTAPPTRWQPEGRQPGRPALPGRIDQPRLQQPEHGTEMENSKSGAHCKEPPQKFRHANGIHACMIHRVIP